VLTGFKGVDHDHAIHGVIFGPDGHLYLSNGDQGLDVTDRQGVSPKERASRKRDKRFLAALA